MIVDSSAVLAVLFEEPDAARYAHAIASARSARISAANFVEVAVVVEAQTRGRGSRQLDAFMQQSGISIEPVSVEQAHIARQAYADFGKGCRRAATRRDRC